MHTPLKERLWAYIVSNHPDLMHQLQDEYNVVRYLDEKVSAVMPMALKLLEDGKSGPAIIGRCMETMKKDLGPSRYHYVLGILTQQFEAAYKRLTEAGLLTYEAVNLVDYCRETFEAKGFGWVTEDDPDIRDAVTEQIRVYLEIHPI